MDIKKNSGMVISIINCESTHIMLRKSINPKNIVYYRVNGKIRYRGD